MYTTVGWDGWKRTRTAWGQDGKKARKSGNKTGDGEAKMSFDGVRDSLVISFAEGLMIFLYEEYESVNPFYPYLEFEPFRLDFLDSSECPSSD